MSYKFRNIYSFDLFNDTNFWIFAHEYLVDMRYECRVTNMMKLIVSWIDVSNLLDLNSWQSKFDSHFLQILNSEFFTSLIEIFNLYRSFDKHFVEFSTSNVNFSSFFIQKSINKSKKSIKISKNNCDNIAITCKTIETFNCL